MIEKLEELLDLKKYYSNTFYEIMSIKSKLITHIDKNISKNIKDIKIAVFKSSPPSYINKYQDSEVLYSDIKILFLELKKDFFNKYDIDKIQNAINYPCIIFIYVDQQKCSKKFKNFLKISFALKRRNKNSNQKLVIEQSYLTNKLSILTCQINDLSLINNIDLSNYYLLYFSYLVKVINIEAKKFNIKIKTINNSIISTFNEIKYLKNKIENLKSISPRNEEEEIQKDNEIVDASNKLNELLKRV